MSDAEYIKVLEKANSKLTEIAAIDRQQLGMFQERYDELVKTVKAELQRMESGLKEVETFLSYPANKHGNIQYSEKSVRHHNWEVRTVQDAVKRLKEATENNKNGYY